jgi:tetratricopeptide (TPR) repeat protein
MTDPLAQHPLAQGASLPVGADAGTAGPANPGNAQAIAPGLDPSAAAILALLLKRTGTCVGKDDLLEAGWPGRIVHENSLAKAIGRVRQALTLNGDFTLEAVYGHGYRLDRVASAGRDDHVNADLVNNAKPVRSSRRAWILSGATAALVAVAFTAAFLLTSEKPVARATTGEADALLAFLSEDLILPTDPYAAVPANMALRDVVERTAETMDERFAGQPGALTALNIMVAKAFSGWGEYDRAVNHLTSARSHAQSSGAADRVAARLIEIDALACQQMRLAGQTRRAEQTCTQAAAQGETLESPHRFMALVNLGKLQFEIGKYADAAASLDKILDSEASVTPEIRADALWFRGLALRKLARFDAAERDFAAHVKQREVLHGLDHPLTAWAHSDYGDYLAYVGNYDRARKELSEAQGIFDRRLGPDHVESQSPAYSVALIHLNAGEADKAEAILAPMLALYAEKLGRDHFWTAYVMTELAMARAMQGNADGTNGARQLLREVRANAANELYGRPAKAAWFHLRWARAMAEIGDEATARDELRRARRSIAKGFAGDHPWQARADCIAARIEQREGDNSALRTAIANCATRLAASNAPATYPVHADLARLTQAQGTAGNRP